MFTTSMPSSETVFRKRDSSYLSIFIYLNLYIKISFRKTICEFGNVIASSFSGLVCIAFWKRDRHLYDLPFLIGSSIFPNPLGTLAFSWIDWFLASCITRPEALNVSNMQVRTRGFPSNAHQIHPKCSCHF